MALRTRYGYRTAIPSTSTKKQQTRQLSYTGGVDSYTDNDDVKTDTLVYATDARMIKKGRYRTRKGANRMSIPVGEAVAGSVTATTGAGDQIVSGTRAIAQMITVSATGAITQAEVNVRSITGSVGSLLVELYNDNAGAPGDLLATSSIAASSIGSTYAYEPCYFMEAPAVTSADDIWIVVSGQDADVTNYEVSSTTASSDALTMVDDTAWVAAAFSINCKVHVSDASPVKGVFRAHRSNGLNVTLMAVGTTVYTVDETTGATTAIKTGLNAAATLYRFDMAQDKVFWTNGYEKPYQYDLATAVVTQLTSAPEIAHLLIEHKGLMFYGNAVDGSQAYYSNFGVYDEFTSTDFLTIMAPKSMHRHTAYAKLNGVLYVFARRNKYVVFGDSNATWSLDEATDQRGAFSQESVVYDDNFIWHADEDGVHQFNGTESRNLAEAFLSEYQAILDKDSIILEKHANRLYVFYTPNGQASNTECFVINLLLNVYEGKDLGTHISRTFARTPDARYLQGSSRVAALYLGEDDSNNYDNLGSPLHFELRTAYSHFDSPAELKRVPKWRPLFESVAGLYSIDVGYAFNSQPDATWTSISLASNAPRFDTGLLYDSGETYASPGEPIEPQNLFMNGEFKRVQRRYRKIGAHEPVEVDSEVMTLETQRMH